MWVIASKVPPYPYPAPDHEGFSTSEMNDIEENVPPKDLNDEVFKASVHACVIITLPHTNPGQTPRADASADDVRGVCVCAGVVCRDPS